MPADAEPFDQSETDATDPPKQPHPTDPGRWADGTARAGNQIRRVHPRPPDQNDPAIAEQLAEDRDAIIADRGGRDRLSTLQLRGIDRLAVLGLFLRTWESYFLASGLTTRQGRVRSGYAAGYLATLDRWMRLAQQIGLDRHSVEIEGPIEYVKRIAAEREQQQHETTNDAPDASSISQSSEAHHES